MMRSLGLLAAAAVLAAGCSCASTFERDGGTAGDVGSDVSLLGRDTGIDAPIVMDDTGLVSDAGRDAASDAGHDAAPRPDAGMCVDPPPDPTRPNAGTCSACRPPGPGTGTGTGCHLDSDCPNTSTGTNGRCMFGRIGTFCSYDLCFSDANCLATEVCLCDGGNGGGNVCVPGNCHTDADCSGRACSPTFGSCGHYSGFVAYRCHVAGDTCTVDSDCAAGYCAYDEVTAHWACSTSECAG